LLYFCSFGAAVLSFMAFVHLPQHVVDASGQQDACSEHYFGDRIVEPCGAARGGSWLTTLDEVIMVRFALLLMLVNMQSVGFETPRAKAYFSSSQALFGIAYGLCIALLPSIIADSFGNKEISRIIGAIYTSFALAALLGPTAAGWVRDIYGN